MNNQDIYSILSSRRQKFAEHLRTKGLEPDEATLLRHSAFLLSDVQLGMNSEEAPLPEVDEGACTATFTITTYDADRYGDVVIPKGCIPHLKNYRRNPRVFFAHKQNDLPIGSCRTPLNELALAFFDDKVKGTCHFHCQTRESEVVFRLVARKELQASSIGFLPVKASLFEPKKTANRVDVDEMGDDIIHFKEDPIFKPLRFLEWDMVEWSIVPIPANAECLAEHLSRGSVEGEKISPVLFKALEPYAAARKVMMGYAAPSITEEEDKSLDPVRWNRSLSKKFDVENQKLPPSTAQYEIVSKYLGCPVKDIYETHESIPSPRMGSFLTGWRDATAPLKLLGVRNVGYNGSESPPVYEKIQLNSTKSDEFLIEGTYFYEADDGRHAIRFSPSWYGLGLTLYSKNGTQNSLRGVLEKAWELALTTYNFLRGEAFSLSGEFLPKTGETWGDIFITPENEKPIASTLKALNEKKKDFPNRGAVFMGPPGTGKTLSGRVIRNQAEATFIWVSARDFFRSGAFGGLSYAFSLAKELAPSVLFVEDVDNWLGDRTVDFIKTEMDGIGRSSGVWTILTTNTPENLPDTLIDRPGRFHDILKFDNPDDAARRRMVSRWLPDLPKEGEAFSLAVSSTKGFSGAYVYELCHFAKTIKEQEGKTLEASLSEAVKKIQAQKEMVGNRSSRKSLSSFTKSMTIDPVSITPRVLINNEQDTNAAGEVVKEADVTPTSEFKEFGGEDLIGPPVSPPVKEEDPEKGWPLGAKFLSRAVKSYGDMCKWIKEADCELDQPRVKKFAQKKVARLTKLSSAALKLGAALYPDKFSYEATPEEKSLEEARTKIKESGEELVAKEIVELKNKVAELETTKGDTARLEEVLTHIVENQKKASKILFEVTGRK